MVSAQQDGVRKVGFPARLPGKASTSVRAGIDPKIVPNSSCSRTDDSRHTPKRPCPRPASRHASPKQPTPSRRSSWSEPPRLQPVLAFDSRTSPLETNRRIPRQRRRHPQHSGLARLRSPDEALRFPNREEFRRERALKYAVGFLRLCRGRLRRASRRPVRRAHWLAAAANFWRPQRVCDP